MSAPISIDFGTSNSTVGCVQNSGPHLIALEDGKSTMPSALFFDTAQKTTLFGRRAIAAYVDCCEGRLLRSLKSILGTSLMNEGTEIGGKKIPFKLIIGKYIHYLKAQAEAEINQSVDCVVMGRPVWFVDEDENADRCAQQNLEEIALASGFKHVSFQFEPIAAALDYEQSVTQEELALIIDSGGGTSDFSIVRVSPDRRGKHDRKQDILANTGVHVGGTDLDKRLSLDQVMPHFGMGSRVKTQFDASAELDIPLFYYHDLATWHKIPTLYTHKIARNLRDLQYRAVDKGPIDNLAKIIHDQNGHRLAGDVESAKIILSDHESVDVSLNYIVKDLSVTLLKKNFEKAITIETQKIVQQIQICLKQADIKADQITTLFVTGGSTAVPSLAKACREQVPLARLVAGDRFGSVGTGLAIEANLRY